MIVIQASEGLQGTGGHNLVCRVRVIVKDQILGTEERSGEGVSVGLHHSPWAVCSLDAGQRLKPGVGVGDVI